MVIIDKCQPVGLGEVVKQAVGQAQREKGNPYLKENLDHGKKTKLLVLSYFHSSFEMLF